MNSDSHDDALPPAILAALEELRGVRAPAELELRVTLARGGAAQAPPELWRRVSADLAAEFGAAPARRGRVLRWAPRLAAAAGLAVLGWIGWAAWSGGEDPAARADWLTAGPAPHLAEGISSARSAELLAGFAVVDVPPARLAPAARAWAGLLSGPGGEGVALPMQEEG